MSYALIGALMIAGPAIYAVTGVLVSRRILHGRVCEGHNDVLVPIFLNAGVLFAVLLGFMVVAVWESNDAAKNNVSTEAAALVPLYRATFALPKDAGDKMRELSREYVHQVIEDEWVSQATTGAGSSKARKAIGNLFRAFGDGTISGEIKKDYPFICTELMNSINEITNDRNKRNIQANEQLPLVMWIAILSGALVIVSMSFMIYMEMPVPHMIMSSMMAALIGLLLFSCVLLNQPFKGPIAISPESFEKTLQVFDDVDRGN
ncbi:MAG TPA: hypothetical protein VK660_01135 [Xanthomonadaceae bacterium]|jgi:hypothetical protein|nr:hypothetical protein [Xanthomonadaceae bacterium]